MIVLVKVEVAYKSNTTARALGSNNLVERLPYIVAEALNDSQGSELECGNVEPEGISLRVRQCGGYDKLCRGADIEITITAKHFPGRSMNLHTRAQRIRDEAKKLVQNWIKIYVAIWLAPAAFAQS